MRPDSFPMKASLSRVLASLETQVRRSTVARYATAPVCITVVYVISSAIGGAAPSLAFSLLVIAVVAAAWFGGMGPALLAAVLATPMIPRGETHLGSGSIFEGNPFLTHFLVLALAALAFGLLSSRWSESLERYRRVLEAGDDGFWEWIVAKDRVYVSPRFLEIYGFVPGTTFLGRDDLINRIPFHPADRSILQRALADHLSGGAARYRFEVRFIIDGRTRWVQLVGKASRDRRGNPVSLTGTIREITQSKEAEDALRESEHRYELAMAASESGYWDWHVLTNEYVASDRAYEMGGYEPGSWSDRDDFRARINMHPDDFARWESAREALFSGTGDRLAMEVRYIVRGQTRWHSLQAICRRDESGRVIRWTGSTTDITARREAEERLVTMERRLRQAQRLEAMGTLASGIAHDFNNILGAILGYGEMALRDALRGSRLARDIESIMVAGERGRALIERLLTFSRSPGGEREVVHVEAVVREAVDQVRTKAPIGVLVRYDFHAGAAAVHADSTQIHQVVANLAINAVQAMPAGGTLRVDVGVDHVEGSRVENLGVPQAGEYVTLTISDTGTGIRPELIDRIFDPFFTTKEVGTGTGLGLSIVHGIVTELGGAIDVHSRPDHGTAFTVHLPRHGNAAQPTPQNDVVAPRGLGQRILVVDDEEPLVNLATRALEAFGYRPVGFTSSTAALAAFRADPKRFDALITDERMPEMPGSLLIQEVRAICEGLPIVLMSGHLELGSALESPPKAVARLAADSVLQKPISANALAACLAQLLHGGTAEAR